MTSSSSSTRRRSCPAPGPCRSRTERPVSAPSQVAHGRLHSSRSRWVTEVPVRKPLIVGSVLLAGAFAGTGIAVAAAASSGNPDPRSEQQAEAAYTADHRADAAVTEQQAVATATAAHPGQVIDVHLESE